MNRIETKASQTALVVCLIRAASNRETIPELKSNDYLAARFIPPPLRLLVKIGILRNWFRRKTPQDTYPYIVARTKYIDEVFSRAVKHHVDQIVILGAGYDTRGIRLVKPDTPVRVFEIDAPTTQRAKLKQLQSVAAKTPITHIAVDFNHESLRDKLIAAGFKAQTPTLYILEGLTMYLEPAAIDDLFAMMREFSQGKGEVVFDYIYPAAMQQSEISKVVAQVQEQFRFGIERKEMAAFLQQQHLSLIENLDTQALGQKYHLLINSPHAILHAKI